MGYIVSPESENSTLFWVGLFAGFLILVVNIPLLWIVNKAKTTLINQLIGLDCLVALLHIPLALNAGRVTRLPCWMRQDAI